MPRLPTLKATSQAPKLLRLHLTFSPEACTSAGHSSSGKEPVLCSYCTARVLSAGQCSGESALDVLQQQEGARH